MYNRKDMYNDYSDQSLTYYYDTIFNGDVKAMFEWSYGDTTPLSFVFTSEDGFENKEAEITFYNFRYEILYKIEMSVVEGEQAIEVDEHTFIVNITIDSETNKANVILDIDSDVSSTFVRGIYYCSSKLIDTEKGTITTIIPQDRGLIYVR